eukprot:SAG11_NODE_38502_length_252_cov_0.666667_1_plen_58_part_01
MRRNVASGPGDADWAFARSRRNAGEVDDSLRGLSYVVRLGLAVARVMSHWHCARCARY